MQGEFPSDFQAGSIAVPMVQGIRSTYVVRMGFARARTGLAPSTNTENTRMIFARPLGQCFVAAKRDAARSPAPDRTRCVAPITNVQMPTVSVQGVPREFIPYRCQLWLSKREILSAVSGERREEVIWQRGFDSGIFYYNF